ncbi:MAG: aspartate kinase [Chloroflexota bacterium]|nr:aspartate kinase [Chloroflexota bacterium]
MTTTVLKFGGTSVGSPDAVRAAVDIIAATEGDRVVVVSATAGTTNALMEAARLAAEGDDLGAQRAIGMIADRHQDLAADLLGDGGAAVQSELAELAERTSALLRSVAILRECTPRSRDAIVSYGERACAPIVAAALAERDIASASVGGEDVVVTDDTFGEASPLQDETRERVRDVLGPLMRLHHVPVVAGYVGATRQGVTTTLGRGASDYTAALLAAALPADDVRIYTDVSGVMSADPRLVPDARPLVILSYAEIAELSHFGARVLHPRAVLPAVEAGIPVRILNTFAPGDAGTTITAQAARDGSIVKATTSLGGLGLITVQGAGMSGIPGFAARVFDTAADERVSVLMISQSSSENTICLVVPGDAADRLRGALERNLERELGRHDVERVSVEAPVAIVAAVGEGMRGTPGVAARVFAALGTAGVNVIAIAQGSSERNISLVVAEDDRRRAVTAIHDQFRSGG